MGEQVQHNVYTSYVYDLVARENSGICVKAHQPWQSQYNFETSIVPIESQFLINCNEIALPRTGEYRIEFFEFTLCFIASSEYLELFAHTYIWNAHNAYGQALSTLPPQSSPPTRFTFQINWIFAITQSCSLISCNSEMQLRPAQRDNGLVCWQPIKYPLYLPIHSIFSFILLLLVCAH